MEALTLQYGQTLVSGGASVGADIFGDAFNYDVGLVNQNSFYKKMNNSYSMIHYLNGRRYCKILSTRCVSRVPRDTIHMCCDNAQSDWQHRLYCATLYIGNIVCVVLHSTPN